MLVEVEKLNPASRKRQYYELKQEAILCRVKEQAALATAAALAAEAALSAQIEDDALVRIIEEIDQADD